MLDLIYCFFGMSFCACNSFPKGEYSDFFIVAAFPSKSFFGKTSLPIKNLYLLTFPVDKAKLLAVCLNCIELCLTRFCYRLF